MTNVKDCQTACYSVETQEALAIIDLIDIYTLGTCIHSKNAFLTKVRSLNESPEIKVLLLFNSPGVLGDEDYCRFVSNAITARDGGTEFVSQTKAYSHDPIQLEKQANALTQIIREIVQSRKLIVVGFEGDVVTPYFGAGLAADYRFGTDDMTFQPSHIKLGMIPSGGLGFFLPRFVSQTKTRDILFTNKPTSASELYQLGLLDGHFPSGEFRNACTRYAENLATMPLATMMGIKSIVHSYSEDLMAFLKYEDKVTAQVNV